VEPASTFENANDYYHVFSCEESIGQKLLSAVYEAKVSYQEQYWRIIADVEQSHTMGQNNTGLQGGFPPQRKGTIKGNDGPLVDLQRENSVDRSAFTGKGLLKV
jgi:hypothetical protein